MTTETDGSGMEAETLSTYTPPSYAIDPEDRSLADEILKMDPIKDVPSDVRFPAHLKLNLKATALPPEERRKVEAELEGVHFDRRPGLEAQLVAKAIEAKRGTIRTQIGHNPNALPYHSEMLTIANEYQEAQAEADRIFAELGEVSHYEPDTDPQTGEPVARAVFAIEGSRRVAMEQRIKDLTYKSSLLVGPSGEHGPEAKRRLDKALQESVGVLKARREELAINAAAKAQAVEMERKRKIDERAEQIARHSRNEMV